MKRSNFRQLSISDRIRIEVYLSQCKTQYEIAKILKVHRSTVSREIKNRGGILRGYVADYAQKDYEREKAKGGVKRKIEYLKVGGYIIDRLKSGWSPEVISGRLKKEIREGKRPPDDYVCHESIYQFIYDSKYARKEQLRMYLRNGKRRRTKMKGRKTSREIIPNRIWIDNRPEEVDTRQQFGHWEGDAIIYKHKYAIQSIVERKTRFMILTKLKRKTVEQTTNAFINGLKDHQVRSLTLDNGTENRDHQKITKELGVGVYFCHPYHSWEKGTNEHGNGLVRRYLPRKTELEYVTQEDIDDISWELNNRPRKILGFSTAFEMLELEYSKQQLQVNVAFDYRV